MPTLSPFSELVGLTLRPARGDIAEKVMAEELDCIVDVNFADASSLTVGGQCREDTAATAYRASGIAGPPRAILRRLAAAKHGVARY